MSEAEQAMIWKGMQGGILAEMFPAVDRFGGLMPSSSPGPGFATTSTAAAVAAQIQAQENLLRLQQQQQQHGGGQGHKHLAQQPLGFHPGPPAQIMSQPDMARMFPASHGFVPAPAPSPGPRPRPVGGDDTSPGCTPDCVTRTPHQPGNTDNTDNSGLVIGSWDEECEKDNATGFFGLLAKLNPT